MVTHHKEIEYSRSEMVTNHKEMEYNRSEMVTHRKEMEYNRVWGLFYSVMGHAGTA